MEYGCIGEHLSHSFSGEIHRRIAPYSYELREIPREDLEEFLTRKAFRAINVTIPYKEAVTPYLHKISPEAAAIGAVNTVVNRDGRLYGYNTDFFGMRMLLEHAGISVHGKKTVILGTGGTSKTAAAVARSLGASEILQVSRQESAHAISYETLLSSHTDAQILINTTPVGMFPGENKAPVPLSTFSKLTGVADAVYHPLRTKLVSEAAMQGIPAEAGLYMLVAQAVRAAEIFTDSAIPARRIAEIYREIAALKENIVLIGMPGSGKTTVGRLLAERTGREFLDTDAMLEADLHCSVRSIFDRFGEAEFRKLESRVLQEQVAPLTGKVIATGGGAILSPDNVQALKQNGTLLWLDRPLSLLTPTLSRPTASTPTAMAERFGEREPLYRRAADHTFDGSKMPEEIVSEIMEELSL